MIGVKVITFQNTEKGDSIYEFFYDYFLKKSCVISIVLSMLFCLTPFSAWAADIKDGHWSAKAVAACRNYGILDGEDAGYDPDEIITRAEFCAMINRAFNFTETAGAKIFSDVNYSGKYGNDLKIASAMGYLSGYGYKQRNI